MLTVSSREFRSQQKSYLDKASEGTEILITRKNEAFRLVKVSEEDMLINQADLLNKLNKAREEYKRGETLHFENAEEMNAWLASL